jgi:hypothetical protein
VNLYQVLIWSIAKQQWRPVLTTGDKERARETYSRYVNNGLSPRLIRL